MYKLSADADRDYAAIYEHTLRAFGKLQARAYRDALKDALVQMAKNPLMAPVFSAASDIRRLNFGAHAVYFQIRDQGILIVRILHQRMDAPRHITDTDA